jgi:GWxTD domain-containing protein
MRLAVDYAGFRSSAPDSTLVEIYHSIPYDQLRYQTFGDTIYAEYRATLKLTDLASGATTTQSVLEPAVIPSFAEAERRHLSIAHSFSVNLAPGRYLMELEIRDSLDQGSVRETLVVRDLSRSGPSISDLIIGASLAQSQSGVTSVLPLPSRTFGPALAREMYVYFDGYDLSAPAEVGARSERDTIPNLGGLGHVPEYEIAAAILDSSGAVVKSLPAEKKTHTSAQVHEIFGLTTQGLAPGHYTLQVSLRDLASGRGHDAESCPLRAQKAFFVARGELVHPTGSVRKGVSSFATDTLTMTTEERRNYAEIRYLATERERKEYEKLSAPGKQEFLKRFWKQHDFRTYLQRLQAADARFRAGNQPGRLTDRGRIYLRYGEPDEIEVHTMIEHAKPHEHWHYYRMGFHFIFVDVRSDGRLRLVYSNTDDERKDPNWQNLVDPLELDDLER